MREQHSAFQNAKQVFRPETIFDSVSEKLCSSFLQSKESACNSGDLGSIPGLGGSPGEGNIYPLQYSGLENSTDYSS